jgi:chaperonin GroES
MTIDTTGFSRDGMEFAFARAYSTANGNPSKEGSPMPIKPLYDRVLVKRVEEEEEKVGSIIIPDTAKENPQEGIVIAVGEGKVLDNGERVALSVGEGDTILFGKYSGTEVKYEDTEYLIMREEDILAKIVEG